MLITYYSLIGSYLDIYDLYPNIFYYKGLYI